jgi:hypothetical protein
MCGERAWRSQCSRYQQRKHTHPGSKAARGKYVLYTWTAFSSR